MQIFLTNILKNMFEYDVINEWYGIFYHQYLTNYIQRIDINIKYFRFIRIKSHMLTRLFVLKNKIKVYIC